MFTSILLNLIVLAEILPHASAYIVDPPTTAAADTAQDCSAWHVAQTGDTCDQIAESYWITPEDFASYNPIVTSACKLVNGNSYCIERNYGIPVPTSKPSPTPTPTPAPGVTSPIKPSATIVTPTNGVNTPKPIQTGMVSNCDEFYLVKKDDNCYNIAQKYGISLDQFYAWNPAVGTNCATLWPENYVCVSIIGVQPTKTTLVTSTAKTTSWTRPPICWFDKSKGQYNCDDPQPTPTTTKPGNGITTPTPIQTGMTLNCKKFYKVVKGDGCWAIADANKINLDDFYKWNPAVGTSCGGLYPDNYVCVGI